MAKIEINNLSKIYGKGEAQIIALDKATFSLNEGEVVVILGPSGAGKSTLLNIMGGMDKATSGSYIIDEDNITNYNEKRLSLFRRHDIGFVFQFYNLLPNLNALENVEIAASLTSNSLKAKEVLEEVGLLNRLKNFPAELSGGEQQRVAIARAIVKKPKLLLCDEPTGALDSKTGSKVISLLTKIAKDYNTTVVIVTHNANIAKIADHLIRLADGKIIEDKLQAPQNDSQEIIW